MTTSEQKTIMDASVEALKGAARIAIATNGAVIPMASVLGERDATGYANGDLVDTAVLLDDLDDRQAAIASLRALAEKCKALQVALMVEAWVVSTPTLAEAQKVLADCGGKASRSPQRKEAVVITVLRSNGERAAWMAMMTRDDAGHPSLGEWTHSDHVDGLFAEILPPKARA